MEDLSIGNLADELIASNKFSRRVLLKGWVCQYRPTNGHLRRLRKIIEDITNRPIRRRLRTGSGEVDNRHCTYRAAVTAMKALREVIREVGPRKQRFMAWVAVLILRAWHQSFL